MAKKKPSADVRPVDGDRPTTQPARHVAYLSLHAAFPDPTAWDEQLPKSILDYHDQLETKFYNLSRLKHVTDSPPSSWMDDGEDPWWQETYSLNIWAESAIESTANRIVKLVRETGFKFRHRFCLEKVVELGGAREVYHRQVFPVRETRWIRDGIVPLLRSAPASNTTYQKHLSYLSKMAGRCYLVGGNDIYAILRNDDELYALMDGLSLADRADLVDIYRTIVRKKHHQRFLKWLKEQKGDCDRPAWANEFAWFLNFLDRLREGGLLSHLRGVAKKTVLFYWDDYLCGEPYLDEEEY